jgi:germination protein M
MRSVTKRLINLILCLLLIVSTLLGCSESAALDSEKVVQVYYINNDETGILFENYEVKADMEDTTAVIEELLDRMQTMPEKLEYEAPIYGPIKLLSYSYNTGLLTLNFDSSYVETDSTIEILDRAAMVRTLTQIPDVENVAFMIAGNPLTDVNGNIIGNMSADSFVYNAGNEINTYEKVELVLYFATEDGKKLVPVYRSVVYNSNIPMQRLAVEQILKGPNTDVAFPTLNSQTKINSVSVRDGVCYVDFDNNFLIQPHAVTPDVAIYSLVNTLCAITDTNKVQISVGGSSDVIFMETVSLGTVFERNLDIVE